MGVVVADSAIHLGQQLDVGDAITGGHQADHHIGHLLAHRGWAGGLAVGAAEHGHVGVGVGHVAQFGNHCVQRGQQHLLAPGLELQRVAGVVDVFAGAAKVHELAGGQQLGACVKFGLDPVFHRFDVVVGGFFNRLDGFAVGLGELLHKT